RRGSRPPSFATLDAGRTPPRDPTFRSTKRWRMTTTSATPARDVLTQIEAEARAARVSDVRYDLHISITPKSETYRGEVTITFALAEGGDLFLDHRGKTIETLEVNGQRIESPDWNGYRLTLPGS